MKKGEAFPALDLIWAIDSDYFGTLNIANKLIL